MITIESISPEKAALLKSVRLQALQDMPSAFGSTYARESAFDDDEWLRRATPDMRRITYLALDAGDACGIVGGFLDPKDKTRAHLVSMWVAPTHRQLGVGKQLVQSVVGWAKAQGVKTLLLFVTDNNGGAISFYERIGFKKTGHTMPYPNDPSLFEYEMLRTI